MNEIFIKFPCSVRSHSGLTNNAKLVYLSLIDYAYGKGYCSPSQSRLADELGISVRTVIRGIEELRKRGFIRVYREVKKRNQYFIVPLDLVMNLKRDRKIGFLSVPKEEQFINSKSEFDELIKWNVRNNNNESIQRP